MGSRGTCLGLVLQRVSSVPALVLCFIPYKFGTMSGVMQKKRNVDAENRQFQDQWTEDYYFILNKGLPVCLLCNEAVSVNKEYNLKRPKHRWTTMKGRNTEVEEELGYTAANVQQAKNAAPQHCQSQLCGKRKNR
jgi:hypothetical protein